MSNGKRYRGYPSHVQRTSNESKTPEAIRKRMLRFAAQCDKEADRLYRKGAQHLGAVQREYAFAYRRNAG